MLGAATRSLPATAATNPHHSPPPAHRALPCVQKPQLITFDATGTLIQLAEVRSRSNRMPSSARGGGVESGQGRGWGLAGTRAAGAHHQPPPHTTHHRSPWVCIIGRC